MSTEREPSEPQPTKLTEPKEQIQAAPATTSGQKPATQVSQKPAEASKTQKPARELTTAEKLKLRRRRGAFAAGALAMPIIGLGTILMAIPLGIWYVTTVFKTVIVVIMNIVAGKPEAAEVNDALGNIDPGSMTAVSLSLVIVGAVLIVAAIFISYFMLRAYEVQKPFLVTLFSIPMGSVLVAIVSASIGALGGLMFRSATQTVDGTLSSAPWGIAGFAIACIAVSIAIGAGVWWWVSSILRSGSAGEESR